MNKTMCYIVTLVVAENSIGLQPIGIGDTTRNTTPTPITPC